MAAQEPAGWHGGKQLADSLVVSAALTSPTLNTGASVIGHGDTARVQNAKHIARLFLPDPPSTSRCAAGLIQRRLE